MTQPAETISLPYTIQTGKEWKQMAYLLLIAMLLILAFGYYKTYIENPALKDSFWFFAGIAFLNLPFILFLFCTMKTGVVTIDKMMVYAKPARFLGLTSFLPAYEAPIGNYERIVLEKITDKNAITTYMPMLIDRANLKNNLPIAPFRTNYQHADNIAMQVSRLTTIPYSDDEA